MTLDQFEAKYYGKSVPNNHGGFVGECVSLAARWAQEGQGVADGDRALYCGGKTGGARDLWEAYGQPGMYIQNFYDQVNTPQEGDLVIWGSNMGYYGDVAIYSGAGQVFGQLGTPVFLPAAARQMTPTPLGYLRRKGTNYVNDDARTTAVFQSYLFKTPSQADLDYWRGRPNTELDDNAASSRFAQDAATIADLQRQLSQGGTLPTGTYLKVNKDDIKEVK